MHAEQAYLFRHALLRDAAYQLQLPQDRAQLHTLAFELIESIFGGRAPEPPPLEFAERVPLKAHPTDVAAAELAEHARLAQGQPDADIGTLVALQRLYLRRAAETAEAGFRNETAAALWLQLADLQEGLPRLRALMRVVGVFLGSGQPARALPLCESALAIARALADPQGESTIQATMALLLQRVGRIAEAESHLHASLAVARKHADSKAEAFALGTLAGIYLESGRLAEAEPLFLQAASAIRAAGDLRKEGVMLGNLGLLLHESGRLAEAEAAHRQALALHIKVGNRRFEGLALGHLAIVLRSCGRIAESEQLQRQALDILREVGDRRSEGMALGNLSLLFQESGRLEAAEIACLEELAIDREISNRRGEGICLGNLAGIYYSSRRFAEAEAAYLQSLAIHRAVKNRRFEGSTLCNYGLCLLEMGRIDAAVQTWRSGAQILLELKHSSQLQRKINEMREACARAGVPPLE